MVTQTDTDVIVIGAGLSGLEAADKIQKAGKRVLVLEARERIGGRLLSHELAGGIIELGGQWVGPTQDRILARIRDLGLHTFPQYQKGKKILWLDGEKRLYKGLVPRVRLTELLETGWNLWKLERMARQIPLSDPMLAKDAKAFDAITTEAWLQDTIRTKGAKTLLRFAHRMIMAAEPSEISFLFFLQYLHSGGGITRLAEVRHGAQQDRIIEGAQQIPIRMAQRLEGQVDLGEPVLALEQTETHVLVTTDKRRLTAKRVIVAIPPAFAAKIEMGPSLSKERTALHQKMPMGSVLKCIIAYPQAFWRDEGFCGEALSDEGPICATFDDTSHDGRHPALVAFLVGEEARRCSAMTPEERKTKVLQALVRLFGPKAGQPSEYIDKDWLADPWSQGCYVGLMPPGLLSETSRHLRTPSGRLHFAGTETALRWMGYMDGALEAGDRAASEVLAAL